MPSSSPTAVTCYCEGMEISALLSKLSDTMYVSRSFGPASEHYGVTMIPVAMVV